MKKIFIFTFFAILIINSYTQEIQIVQNKITDDISSISGEGGNIGVFSYNDGILVIDSQFEKNSTAILDIIKKISVKPIKYLINTHYHNDHTNGNHIIGKNAIILMHQNAKKSFETSKSTQSANKSFLPQVQTITEKKLNLGNETIHIFHKGPAHTSGDLIIVFQKNKVIHVGDILFNGIYPFIDVADGASTINWINILEYIIKTYPDHKIIPGHGEVTDVKGLVRFANYLKTLRNEVLKAIKQGKSKQEAIKTIKILGFPMAKFKFLNRENNISWVYDELVKK